LSRARLIGAKYQLEQCRLAGAAWAGEEYHLAFLNFQTDVAQRLKGRRIGF
jgi:hypothetical protein